MGMTYLKETIADHEARDGRHDNVAIVHHNVGFMAQRPWLQKTGYYVDVRALVESTISKHEIIGYEMAKFQGIYTSRKRL